jgi:hypothetical protein
VSNGLLDRECVFYFDKTWFTLSGYTNGQNNRYWSTENPHAVHEEPVQDVKVRVCCMISAWRIIGTIFLDETVNSEYYVRLILIPFSDQ